MAILDLITVGSQVIIVVDSDPTIGGVTAAPGSLILMSDGSAHYIKYGASDTSWSKNITIANISSAIATSTTDSSITGKFLTGYVSGAGTIAATDSILQAIQKLNGNIATLTTGVSSVFGRTGVVIAQSGDYTTTLVTEGTNLYYTQTRFDTAFSAKSTTNLTEGTNLYFTNARVISSTLTGYVSGAGIISTADSILSAIQKLNGNTAALVTGVSSVFGRTGAVVAVSGDYTTTLVTEGTNLYYTQTRFDAAFAAKTTTNLSEGTNLYFTNARVLSSTLTGYVSGAGTIAATDTILSSIQKLNGNDALKATITYVDAQDATTLASANAYSDGLANGLSWKKSVLYSTTTGENLTLTGLTATIDGTSRTLLVTDRILVKNQTTASQNGLYNPNSGAWTRVTDANTNTTILAATVLVREGSAERNRVYSVNISPITLGTTNITFALIAGSGTYTNGTYLKLTSNVFDIDFTTFATSNITEGTNLYFTSTRAITALTGQSNTLFTNGAGYLIANQTITLSGDVTGSGTTAITTAISNTTVTGKLLTGYVSGAGTIAATDSILSAIQKLNGNTAALVTGVSSVFGRTGAVVAAAGDYTTTLVTEGTNLYFTNARAIASVLTGYVSGAGTISATDSILSSIQKLNGNISALITGVSSVNGLTGAVSLTGTLNRITISAANVFDIAATYVGQSSITTLGTITTGVWNGTAIANANLANSSIILGSTSISLGGTSTTLAGLTSVTSTTFVGALTGNATTATVLQTARTINGVAFDGTSNITVTASAGTLTGTTLNSTVVSSSLTSVGIITIGTWNGTSINTTYTDAKIKGGVAATAGLITFGTGTADTVTTDSNIVWDNTNKRLGIGNTPTAKIDIAASTTANASLRLRTGVAPTAPNTGDTYQDGTHCYMYLNSTWKILDTILYTTVNTTDATLTTLQTIAIPTNSAILIESRINSIKTGGAGTGTIGDTNSYIRVVKVKNVGGTLTLGTTSSSYTNEDITPFNATFVISGTNVIVQVLGAVNDNVTWTVSSVITQ